VQGVISTDRYHEIAKRLEFDGIIDNPGNKRPRKVARGYFGRPDLLDHVYKASNQAPKNGQTSQNQNSDLVAVGRADPDRPKVLQLPDIKRGSGRIEKTEKDPPEDEEDFTEDLEDSASEQQKKAV
jgi:hypothetical protein